MLGSLAQSAVGSGLRNVQRRAARALRTGRDEDLHSLRKAVKRLRYNLEFFAPLLADGGREALDLLERAQNRLGTIVDAVAFDRTYAGLLERFGPDDPRRAGLEACREVARVRHNRAVEGLRELWSRGDGYPVRLAAAISSALGSLSPKSEP